ncbi:MFS transporter [Actinospica durhamensis]|uniref:MFS transporter n=1 Tax=Actinospica durhamensis TaxID=1508375 RepID=A0A941ILB2_9ACTN|nr:MFS transporter [Actinospica durhamensis]MBR7832800.1 MFS transporter [Actinospica durhamensis]
MPTGKPGNADSDLASELRRVSDPTAASAETPPLGRPTVLLLAAAVGSSAASLYYAQPLLASIRHDLSLGSAAAGLTVTVTQLGYALGLMLAVPLGDLLERRRLVMVMCCVNAAALALCGASPDAAVFFVSSALIGVFAATAQILVAFSANLAAPQERGRVVGTVMSGLLLGILAARTVAGYLAQAGGWRTVYACAAGLMLLFALALRLRLPQAPRMTELRYGALLRSTLALMAEEPVLRIRALYGALAFAGFSALWAPLGLMLAGPPHYLSTGLIGLFGLAGLAGALGAPLAGRIADRGGAARTTLLAAVLLTLSWLPTAFGRSSVPLLVLGIVVFDFACQSLHITNQSEVYRLRPDARSRLTSAYMTCYFIGGVVGSALASVIYAEHGWAGSSLLGAGFGACTVLVWAGQTLRRRRAATADSQIDGSSGSGDGLAARS